MEFCSNAKQYLYIIGYYRSLSFKMSDFYHMSTEMRYLLLYQDSLMASKSLSVKPPLFSIQINVIIDFLLKVLSKYWIKPFFTFAVCLFFRISLIDSNAVVKRIVLLCLNIRLDNCYENIVARISQNVYLQRTSLSAFDRTLGSPHVNNRYIICFTTTSRRFAIIFSR